MRIYWVDTFKKGNLGMMARPKGNDWLEDEILKLKKFKVGVVVSLLEKHEELTLEIAEESRLCSKHDIEFINFSIPDRGTPKDINAFVTLITHIDSRLKDEKNVVVHCRMGIGRTTLVTAALLLKNDFEPEDIFSYLSEIRTLTVPDTKAQKEWIYAIKNKLKKE